MKNRITYIVVVVLLLSTLSCSKDSELLVDSKSELCGTFWKIGDVSKTEFSAEGAVLQEVFYQGNKQYDGGDIMYYISDTGFIEVVTPSIGLMEYSIRPYEYNAEAHTLKVGDNECEVLEFSKSRLKLRIIFQHPNRYVVTTAELVPYNSDKSWAEWVEYIDEYNAKMQ